MRKPWIGMILLAFGVFIFIVWHRPTPSGQVHPVAAPPPELASNSKPAPAPAKNPAPTQIEGRPDCHHLEFQPTPEASRRELESFLDQDNAFPLPHSDLNSKTLCVKVNGRSMNYLLTRRGGIPEIRLGPVVGPDSKIEISYCTGKTARCQEPCAAPKPRFSDALLSDAFADGLEGSWGNYGEDSSTHELKKKTQELMKIADEDEKLNQRALMRDWNTLTVREWHCPRK